MNSEKQSDARSDVSRDRIGLDSFVCDAVLTDTSHVRAYQPRVTTTGQREWTNDESEERVFLDLASRFEEVVQFERGLDTLKLLAIQEFLFELIERLATRVEHVDLNVRYSRIGVCSGDGPHLATSDESLGTFAVPTSEA